MILTHAGKFGDFIPSLTIANHHYKTTGEKTTFILTSWFKQFVGLRDLLIKQDFIQDVRFDSYFAPTWELGAKEYKFKPESVGDEKYYNLGMWTWPDRYLGKLYGDEHGLQYDPDVDFKFVDPNFPQELRGKKLYTRLANDSTRGDKGFYEMMFCGQLEERGCYVNDIGWEAFDTTKPLEYNLNLAHYALDVKMYPEGFSVLADMAKIKYTLHCGSVNQKVYYIYHLS